MQAMDLVAVAYSPAIDALMNRVKEGNNAARPSLTQAIQQDLAKAGDKALWAWPVSMMAFFSRHCDTLAGLPKIGLVRHTPRLGMDSSVSIRLRIWLDDRIENADFLFHG